MGGREGPVAVDGVLWSCPQKLGSPLERRAGGPPGNTHHDLGEGLQRGLELVGGRQGVWEVHGSGQDEQRRGDLLLQVQLQPLQSKVKTWTHLPALPHPHLRPGRGPGPGPLLPALSGWERRRRGGGGNSHNRTWADGPAHFLGS